MASASLLYIVLLWTIYKFGFLFFFYIPIILLLYGYESLSAFCCCCARPIRFPPLFYVLPYPHASHILSTQKEGGHVRDKSQAVMKKISTISCQDYCHHYYYYIT